MIGAACGGKGSPPPPPSPPQVSLTVASSSIVDTQIGYTLQVTGCDAVSSVQILDKGTVVATATYAGNPTQGALAASQVPFATDGIAASLSLTAKAVCADGRSNVSQAVAVTFFPVSQVIRNAGGTQVVPDQFYAEGSGAGVTFVGCSGQPNGSTALVRVDATGAVVAANTGLPFPCSNSTWFTDKNPADPNGTRWMVAPGVGIMAFGPSLQTEGFLLGAYSALAQGPDGDAVAWISQGGSPSNPQLTRVHYTNGQVLWAYQPEGLLTGNPAITSGGAVIVPEFVNQLGMNQGTVTLDLLNYNYQTTPGCTTIPCLAALSAQYALTIISYGFLGTQPPIPTGFSANGTTVYFAYQTPSAQSNVIACSTTPAGSGGCTGLDQRWTSPSLGGVVNSALPFSNGTRIAAVAAQRGWFLDASLGTVVNAGGLAITPTGSLITTGVSFGQGSDVYLLNGSGAALPTEIVAIDDPARGEVFRYDMPSGTLTVAVDDSGQPWMRVGNDLVKTWPLSQYRSVHP